METLRVDKYCAEALRCETLGPRERLPVGRRDRAAEKYSGTPTTSATWSRKDLDQMKCSREATGDAVCEEGGATGKGRGPDACALRRMQRHRCSVLC